MPDRHLRLPMRKPRPGQVLSRAEMIALVERAVQELGSTYVVSKATHAAGKEFAVSQSTVSKVCNADPEARTYDAPLRRIVAAIYGIEVEDTFKVVAARRKKKK